MTNKTILVAYSNIIVGNKPLTEIVTMDQMQEGKHSLEEADHDIVLHSIDIAQNDPETIFDVYSLDTDVFVLLTAFYPEIPAVTTLLRLNNEKLSIPSSNNRIGAKHVEALIGWYSFKGTDNTGEFVSKALKSHFNAFLASDDDILHAFAAFGNDPHISDDIFRQMERYVCLLYKPATSKFESLTDLRWALFAKFGKEGKQLPPTKGTLVPHTRRAYYHALVLKKSILPCPNIPLVTDFSWIEKTDSYIQSSALFHLPLKLFWLSASVDVPRDARTRFAAARKRAYLVQIYVTVKTIAAIETILLRILMDMLV